MFFKKDLREHDGEVAAVFVYSPAVVLRKMHLIFFMCIWSMVGFTIVHSGKLWLLIGVLKF